MWHISERGESEYAGSKEDWQAVARIAAYCAMFKPDDEDELVADELVSCYNCLYRRWTVASFVCLNSSGYRGN